MVKERKRPMFSFFTAVLCTTLLILYTHYSQTVHMRVILPALRLMCEPYSKETHHVIHVQILSIENKTRIHIKTQRKVSLKDEASYIVNTCTEYNWKDVLKPCESRLAWETRDWDRTKQTNVTLSKIEVEVRPVGYASSVKIYTKDDLGRRKNYGGDSWVIKIDGENYRRWFHPKDLLDGTYEGMFVIHQKGTFNLTATLDFSLCDGLLNPPVDFFRKGFAEIAIAKKLQNKFAFMLNDVLRVFSEKLHFSVVEIDRKPKLRKTNDLGGLPHNRCGYWSNGYFHTYNNTRTINHLSLETIKGNTSSQQNTLLLGGDSVTRNLYYNIKKYGLCEKVFHKCDLFYSWIYRRIDQKMDWAEGHDFDIKKYITYQITDRFNSTGNTTNCRWCSRKSFYVVNFGLHAAMRLSFRELQAAFQLFLQTIKELQERIGEEFPTIIWKTTSPVFFKVGATKLQECSFRFMSRPRIYLWNLYTISEARKAGLPVLDGYDMALSAINGNKDRVHNHDFVFTRLIEQLIKAVLKISKNQKALDRIGVN